MKKHVVELPQEQADNYGMLAMYRIYGSTLCLGVRHHNSSVGGHYDYTTNLLEVNTTGSAFNSIREIDVVGGHISPAQMLRRNGYTIMREDDIMNDATPRRIDKTPKKEGDLPAYRIIVKSAFSSKYPTAITELVTYAEDLNTAFKILNDTTDVDVITATIEKL